MIRKILLALLILLVAIQLFRPEKNLSGSNNPNAIDVHYTIPKEIGSVLRNSCYDCHSNNTSYPWYSNVQPFAWWLQNHVNEGKEELNFDEFNGYDAKKKIHKLDEVVEMIKEDEMPLSSYTLIHRQAELSPQDKDMLIAWASKLQKNIR